MLIENLFYSLFLFTTYHASYCNNIKFILQVIFKTHVADLTSNYRENSSLSDDEKYVMDVLNLAKQCKILEIKNSSVKDILKKVTTVHFNYLQTK